MTDAPVSRNSARQRAAKIIAACFDGEARAHDLLDEMQAADPLSPADAALATELALGVIQHRITCEHLAAGFYHGRWEGLRPSLRATLAMGVYQLCWLDRIPDHAAVDQSVRLAKTHGRAAANTTNAILRKIAAIRGHIVEGPMPDAPRRWLPLDESCGRLLEEDVFPDPARRPLDHLVAATGHPMWLVERWHRRFKPRLCRQICEAGAMRPKLVLRANSRRITPDALLERLRASGQQAEFAEGTDAIVLRDAPPVTQLPEFIEGLCQPQDATAAVAVRLAAPKPGEIVLDLCAGVGTKSTQAAEMMNDSGIVIAADINAERLSRAEQNARRLGLSSIRILPLNALIDVGPSPSKVLARPPDVILVDAPCTNTGVLARRPEARYRASQKNLTALVQLQREILTHAARLAGPTTRIVYSTCSLEEEENEQQCMWFTLQFPDWKATDKELTIPSACRGGGFSCLFKKP